MILIAMWINKNAFIFKYYNFDPDAWEVIQ